MKLNFSVIPGGARNLSSFYDRRVLKGKYSWNAISKKI
jgi:hypothetical protein